MYVWPEWTWKWCLVTLKTVDKVMLSIFGDDKFSQPSSFTFFQREEPTILGPNFKFLQRLYIVKLNLEIMFGDVLKWYQSDFVNIWRCQICAAEILDFFKGVRVQVNFKFPLSLCMLKLKDYKWVISQFILNFLFYT